MAYSVLAINPGHNGSVAVVIDNELTFYIEEERLSRYKYDGNPLKAMSFILSNQHIDELVIGGTSNDLGSLQWTNEDAFSALARKYNPNIKITKMGHLHHLGHAACAFYNSGFETAVAVIVDGSGSVHEDTIAGTDIKIEGYETESIYHCSYPHEFNAVYKRYSNGKGAGGFYSNGIQEFETGVTITKAYEAVTNYLGFEFIEAGKTMGLAPYGVDDDNLPDFFINGKGDKNLLIPRYPAGSVIDESACEYLRKFNEPQEWHKDFSLVRDIDKNIAYKIQKETEEQVMNLIQKAIDITGETNVVIAGGYGLNCVANYKYIQRFPNINFYVDPISHDGGSAVGLAKLASYINSQSTDKYKLQSLYLGCIPNYNELSLIQDQNGLEVTDASAEDIVSLLENGNIVSLYQGRSEAGPRALGNRSILFDPRHKDGKDIVNSVKHREWFRPFAASVLEEHAHEWFEMHNLESSPFMMYAVDVKEDKVDMIPAITHVDNTCRIQTVSKEQNEHYYNLINIFYEKTGIPMIFNTSFNLGGQPLVETVIDALNTIIFSDIKYLYLPEIGKLVTKKS